MGGSSTEPTPHTVQLAQIRSEVRSSPTWAGALTSYCPGEQAVRFAHIRSVVAVAFVT
eukprot:COSAG01_NODE_56417_length_318_cov_1.410959_1_plen_57_part_10